MFNAEEKESAHIEFIGEHTLEWLLTQCVQSSKPTTVEENVIRGMAYKDILKLDQAIEHLKTLRQYRRSCFKGWASLPKVAVESVCSYFATMETSTFMTTCKPWKDVASKNKFWKVPVKKIWNFPLRNDSLLEYSERGFHTLLTTCHSFLTEDLDWKFQKEPLCPDFNNLYILCSVRGPGGKRVYESLSDLKSLSNTEKDDNLIMSEPEVPDDCVGNVLSSVECPVDDLKRQSSYTIQSGLVYAPPGEEPRITWVYTSPSIDPKGKNIIREVDRMSSGTVWMYDKVGPRSFDTGRLQPFTSTFRDKDYVLYGSLVLSGDEKKIQNVVIWGSQLWGEPPEISIHIDDFCLIGPKRHQISCLSSLLREAVWHRLSELNNADEEALSERCFSAFNTLTSFPNVGGPSPPLLRDPSLDSFYALVHLSNGRVSWHDSINLNSVNSSIFKKDLPTCLQPPNCPKTLEVLIFNHGRGLLSKLVLLEDKPYHPEGRKEMSSGVMHRRFICPIHFLKSPLGPYHTQVTANLSFHNSIGIVYWSLSFETKGLSEKRKVSATKCSEHRIFCLLQELDWTPVVGKEEQVEASIQPFLR